MGDFRGEKRTSPFGVCGGRRGWSFSLVGVRKGLALCVREAARRLDFHEKEAPAICKFFDCYPQVPGAGRSLSGSSTIRDLLPEISGKVGKRPSQRHQFSGYWTIRFSLGRSSAKGSSVLLSLSEEHRHSVFMVSFDPARLPVQNRRLGVLTSQPHC